MRGSRPGTGRRLARVCRYLAVAGIVLASDVVPTRLQAVEQAAMGLLDQVPADLRVGLVSFSTEAESLVRPTTDRDLVRQRIAGLQPNGGTAIGAALQQALDDVRASTPAARAAVLLFSDGANSVAPDPEVPAATAAARRIPVLAVAVGTPQGLLTQQVPSGGTRFQPVPPDPFQLGRIAGMTGGRAVEARSADELRAGATGGPSTRRSSSSVTRVRSAPAPQARRPARHRGLPLLPEGQPGPDAAGRRGRRPRRVPIRFDMAQVEATARDWSLPLTRIAASVLVHEQEHCIREPDDREIGPLAAERRLPASSATPTCSSSLPGATTSWTPPATGRTSRGRDRRQGPPLEVAGRQPVVVDLAMHPPRPVGTARVPGNRTQAGPRAPRVEEPHPGRSASLPVMGPLPGG